MQAVTICHSDTRLSPQVRYAKFNPSFVMAKTDKPVASQAANTSQRLGFMAGLIAIPDDFDRMGDERIDMMFGAVE